MSGLRHICDLLGAPEPEDDTHVAEMVSITLRLAVAEMVSITLRLLIAVAEMVNITRRLALDYMFCFIFF